MPATSSWPKATPKRVHFERQVESNSERPHAQPQHKHQLPYRSQQKEEESKWTAAHFIPDRSLGLVYMSLRFVVFQVDSKSATPIAYLLRQRLSDAQIYELIHDFNDEKKKIREKIGEVRMVHSLRLRNAEMADVNIMYSGELAGIKIFKEDQEVIEVSVSALTPLLSSINLPKILGREAISLTANRLREEDIGHVCYYEGGCIIETVSAGKACQRYFDSAQYGNSAKRPAGYTTTSPRQHLPRIAASDFTGIGC